MKIEIWIGVAMVIWSHWLLYRHSEARYRFAAAWMMTGAFALASGFATQCFVRCETLQDQISLQAAEPGKRMSNKISIEPHKWSVPTDTGVLSFHGSMFKEPGFNAMRAAKSSY